MEQKKKYVKPEVKEYKSAAIVSGSDDDCSNYKRETEGGTYYY